MLLQLVARFERRVLFFPLPDREVRVGSSPDNDIVIPFPGVSRTHAIVRPHRGQLEIVDAGSTNGLVVDGKLLACFEPRAQPAGTARAGLVDARRRSRRARSSSPSTSADPRPSDAAARVESPNTVPHLEAKRPRAPYGSSAGWMPRVKKADRAGERLCAFCPRPAGFSAQRRS